MQLKNRLDRKRSNDTTSGGSNVTVIEGVVPTDGDVVVVKAIDDLVTESDMLSANNTSNEQEHAAAGLDSSSANQQQQQQQLSGCFFRKDSVRASIKKKVRCSETTELIPTPNYYINCDELHESTTNGNEKEEDDDDVFSDTVAPQVTRGNMCSPYVPRKGSLPIEALPDWFPTSRLLFLSSHQLNFMSFISCFCVLYFPYRFHSLFS